MRPNSRSLAGLQRLDASIRSALAGHAHSAYGLPATSLIPQCSLSTSPLHSYPHACGSPLCVLCQRSLAEMEARRLGLALSTQLAAGEGLKLYHVTATVQDCRTDELRARLQWLVAGWERLTQTPLLKTHCAGWYRALEVDTSPPAPELENPHLHGVLAMRPGYSGRNYLPASEWATLWQECVRAAEHPEAYRSISVRLRMDPYRLANYVVKWSSDEWYQRYQRFTYEPARLLGRVHQMKKLKLRSAGGVIRELLGWVAPRRGREPNPMPE